VQVSYEVSTLPGGNVQAYVLDVSAGTCHLIGSQHRRMVDLERSLSEQFA
jgi:hypothetical protein